VTPSDSENRPVTPTSSESGSFASNVLPALVWTAIVFVLGGIPNPGPPVELEFPIDKIEHAVAFAILQVLALRALRYELPRVLRSAMPWIAALVSIVVAAALELYQLTVPNRNAETMDLVAGGVGAVLAAFVTAWFARRR
jgi:VanZ family protein